MGDAVHRFDFAVMHEAVQEHRLSMIYRPKSSGVDRARAWNTSSPPPLTNAPRNGEELQKTVRTIEFTSGLDTFIFPTPSPRFPPNSATFPPAGSTSDPIDSGHFSGIGLAIGSPSQIAFPPNLLDGYSDYKSASSPLSASPYGDTAHSDNFPLSCQVATDHDQAPRKRLIRWKTIGNLFRKPSKAAPENVRLTANPNLKRGNDSSGFARIRVDTRYDFVNVRTSSHRILTYRRHQLSTKLPHSTPQPEPETTLQRRDSKNFAEKDVISTGKVAPASSPVQEPAYPVWKDIRTADVPERHDSPIDGPTPAIVPAMPKLDIELPSPHLPRFSIMFEAFIQSDKTPKQSLLERRHSRLATLRSLEVGENRSSFRGDELMLSPNSANLRRSLTMPQQRLTPMLSIRSSRDSTILSGTNTNPTSSYAMNRPHPIRRANTAPPLSPILSESSRTMESFTAIVESPRTPWSVSFCSDASSPQTPSAISASTGAGPLCRNIDAKEPVWEMLTSVASDGGDFKSESPRFGHEGGRRIVHMSIARRISVSQMDAPAGISLPAKQPMKPRMVEMGRNRRSAAAVVEGADI